MNLTHFSMERSIAAFTVCCALQIVSPAVAKSITATPIIRTSICQLVPLGHQMDGAHIRIRGMYVTDLLHGALIIDHACQGGALEQGVVAASKDNSVKRFDDIVYRVFTGPGLADLVVDVSGTYTWNKDARPPAQRGSISIDHVWSVEVIDRSEASKEKREKRKASLTLNPLDSVELR